MSRRGRLIVFAVSAVPLTVVLVLGLRGLPAFGDYHGVYGEVLNGLGVTERHATDLVTALNFDIRGFDTLGEEFILFGSVLGIVLILRHLGDEAEYPQEEEADEHHFSGASEALRALSLGLIPSLIALGIYVVVHGALTPGGGFQGGIVLAAGPLAVFVGGRYLRMKVLAPQPFIEISDALGAAGYGFIGLGGLIFVGVFFKNFLPFGIPGHLLSAGTIPLASTAVGLEVTGAFLVAWTEFLDQAMLIKSGGSGGDS